MRRKAQTLFTIAGIAIFLAISGVSLDASAAGEKKQPPKGDFTRGAKLWADNCNRCHNTRDPREFRDDQWKVIVYHMRVRAGLTGQTASDILAFLQGSN